MTLADVHAAIAKVREFASAGQFAEARIAELELFVAFAVWVRDHRKGDDWVAREPYAVMSIAVLKVRDVDFPRNCEDPEANQG